MEHRRPLIVFAVVFAVALIVGALLIAIGQTGVARRDPAGAGRAVTPAATAPAIHAQ